MPPTKRNKITYAIDGSYRPDVMSSRDSASDRGLLVLVVDCSLSAHVGSTGSRLERTAFAREEGRTCK